jgi:hypothetical protein
MRGTAFSLETWVRSYDEAETETVELAGEGASDRSACVEEELRKQQFYQSSCERVYESTVPLVYRRVSSRWAKLLIYTSYSPVSKLIHQLQKSETATYSTIKADS